MATIYRPRPCDLKVIFSSQNEMYLDIWKATDRAVTQYIQSFGCEPGCSFINNEAAAVAKTFGKTNKISKIPNAAEQMIKFCAANDITDTPEVALVHIIGATPSQLKECFDKYWTQRYRGRMHIEWFELSLIYSIAYSIGNLEAAPPKEVEPLPIAEALLGSEPEPFNAWEAPTEEVLARAEALAGAVPKTVSGYTDVLSDWIKYKQEIANRFIRNGRMPNANPPTKTTHFIRDKRGNQIEVSNVWDSFYTTGKEKSTDYFIHSVSSNESRSGDYHFTYGQFEGIFRVMRNELMKERKKKTKKEWFQYIVLPACFDVLTRIQDALTGLLKEIKEEWTTLTASEIIIPPPKMQQLSIYTYRLVSLPVDITNTTPTTHHATIGEMVKEIYLEKPTPIKVGKRVGKRQIKHIVRELIEQQSQRAVIAEAALEDVQESTITKEENVVFTDERPQVYDQGYITSQLQPKMQHVSMQEDEWHIRNIMQKPIVVVQQEWTTSHVSGYRLYTGIVPGDMVKGPHYNLMATTTFFRGHPKIRIQVNSNKFQSGRLIAAFVPRYTIDDDTDALMSLDAMQCCPHVIIDAGASNSGILEIPFVHQNTYFNTTVTREHQSLGVLMIRVFNALGAASGSVQRADVTVWISYENCELHQPCAAHDVKLPQWPKKTKSTRAMTPIAEAAIEGLAKAALPLITDYIAPGMSLNPGNVLGETQNCDKPTDPTEISRWVPNTVTSLNFGDGLDRCNRLSLLPGTATATNSDMISTTKDDMNILEVCKIPVRCTRVQWGTGSSVGSTLTSIPVCPTVCSSVFTDNTVVPNQTRYYPTPMANLGRIFKYWRGSIRLKIQVIASLMHTGRLQVSFGAGILAYNFESSNYLNTYVIDLQEKREMEIIIPYISERPWLRSDKFTYVGDHDLTDKVTGDQVSGIVRLHVLNRLSCPDTVKQIIDINVYISAGDDLQFAVPSDLYGLVSIGTPTKPPTKETQPIAEAAIEKEAMVTTREDEGVVPMTKGGGTISSSAKDTMSEDAMHMLTVLRRYYKCYYNRIKIDNNNVLKIPNTPTLAGITACFNGLKGKQFRTLIAHLTEMFTYWRGSLRYKLIFRPTKNSAIAPAHQATFTVYHVPGVFEEPDFTGATKLSDDQVTFYQAQESLGVMKGSSLIQGSLEFEIPFYSPYTQLDTISKKLSALNSTGTIYILGSAGTDTEFEVELYQSAGDDFLLNYLRFPPSLNFIKGVEASRNLTDTASAISPVSALVCLNGGTQSAKDEPTAEGLLGFPAQVAKSFTNTSATMESLKETSDTANHLLQQAAKKLGLNGEDSDDEEEDNTILNGLSSVADILKMLPSNLSSAFNSAKASNYTFLNEICNAVCGLHTYHTATNILQKACAIVTIVTATLGVSLASIRNKMFEVAVNILNLYGNKQGNQLPVAEAIQLDFVAPLAATLATGTCLLGFNSIPTDKETVDMCKGISEKLRLFNFSSLAITNVQRLWTQVTELVQWLIDTVMQKISPYLFSQMALTRDFVNIEQWAKFIDSLERENFEDRVNYDTVFKKKVFQAVDQGNKYLDLLIRGKIGKEASIVREYVRRITEIGNKCSNAKCALPFRKDPFCVAMFGESGVGKSGCVTSLGFDIMDDLDYPLYNRWCPVNCGEKYFSENYRQQTAVYFDDFAALTSEEQYKNFFNLKANTAYPLDMAFRKGEYFNSDFIFMTTNISHPQPNFVSYHDALLRRRDVLIEVDFLTEAFSDAAARGEYVRQLDHSHAHFRLVNPRINAEPLTDWMDYEAMRKEVSKRAKTFIDNQELKLHHDLVRSGYVVPRAEANLQILSQEAFQNSPHFRLFSPELAEWIVWDPVCFWGLRHSPTEPIPEHIKSQWDELQTFSATAMIDLNQALDRLSYRPRELSFSSKIRGKISDFTEYAKNKMIELKEKHSWIQLMMNWPLKIVGAIAGVLTLYGGVKYVVHKCLCAGITYFGFRCGVCGKWPKLENCLKKEFILSEWATLYGNREYIDSHITTIEEENTIRLLHGRISTEKPEAGTAVAEQGVYSDVTKGGVRTRVVAQNSPYQQDVKGQPRTAVVAHSSKQTEDILANRVQPYLYRLVWDGCVGFASCAMNGFAIGGRNVLVPSHFFAGLELHGGSFRIFHSGAWMEVLFELSRLSKFDGKDLVVYEMPVQFHEHKDMTRHFVREADLAKLRRVTCDLVGLNDRLVNTVMRVTTESVDKIEYAFEHGTIKEKYSVQHAWKYPARSMPGYCGSVLLADKDNISGRILGVHSCGNGIHGWSQLVTKEMVEKFCTTKLGTPIPVAETTFGNLIPQGHFGRIGKTKKGFFQSPKTDIVKTAIHGLVSSPVTGPSVLSINDERLTKRVNPLSKGIGKYGIPPRQFDPKDRQLVNEYIRSQLERCVVDRVPQPLLEEEMIAGIEGLDCFERLPMNTSPGYPYILSRPKGECGKAYLFDVNKMKDEVRDRFEQREKLAKLGERVESVWVDCLKDERRPFSKIAAGSTRVFTIPPVDYSLLMRKYTMDYNAAIQKSRSFLPCKVGINPQSLEWTELYDALRAHSPLCVAGDFTRFDGSIPPELIYDFFDDIYHFYSFNNENLDKTEFHKVITVLANESVHTIHLARDEFYMTHIGNKSGNPVTVQLNSSANWRYMALSWLGLARLHAPEYCSMHYFHKFVKLAIYGDDNLLSISPEIAEWFNQETISNFLDQYGIIYTNEEKTGITKYKSLDECSFLKQTFAKHTTLHGVVVPHMKEATILELLNWTRESPDGEALLLDNCNDALRFAYFYGEEYFKTLRNKISRALSSINLNFTLQTYSDYHQWFLHTIGKL